jgi:hypothetical protein
MTNSHCRASCRSRSAWAAASHPARIRLRTQTDSDLGEQPSQTFQGPERIRIGRNPLFLLISLVLVPLVVLVPPARTLVVPVLITVIAIVMTDLGRVDTLRHRMIHRRRSVCEPLSQGRKESTGPTSPRSHYLIKTPREASSGCGRQRTADCGTNLVESATGFDHLGARRLSHGRRPSAVATLVGASEDGKWPNTSASPQPWTCPSTFAPRIIRGNAGRTKTRADFVDICDLIGYVQHRPQPT